MSRFNRAYEIKLDGNSVITSYVPRPLQVTFMINQEYRNGTFVAEINIYNLNAQSREVILNSKKKKIEFSAGYTGRVNDSGFKDLDNNVAELFSGIIINVSSVNDGKNNITTLFCNTAYDVYKRSTVEKSWPSGTAIQDVIKEIAEGFGTTVVFAGDFSDLGTFQRGYTASSSTNMVLNDLGRIYNFSWGLDNNSLLIKREKEDIDEAARSGFSTRTRQGATTTVIDSRDLLLGKTELVAYGDNYANANIAVKLNPALRACDKVRIDTTNAAISTSDTYYYDVNFVSGGTYTILQVNHQGDFYGDMWETVALCESGG